MRPRPYRLGRRQQAVDKTKAAVLAGARKLLKSRDASKGFTIDAVARHGGVTRATIYRRFKSKTGLLAALYDSLAARSKLREHLGLAFRARSAAPALKKMAAAYCRFWATERVVIRRLHALAALDPEFSKVDRNEWRRQALEELLATFSTGRTHAKRDAVDLLHALTSFEAFDSLARRPRTEKAASRLIAELAVRCGLRGLRG
ncbi:MAG TPA: helix-turn-helix domain-containing protein [Candidatus Eremiobacteraceae bacterium]|nr:helix-turn-helix domain-containing protein [Candidatus Eremiobacteraceae bacterium]